jgi:hypothetical protein
MGLAAVACADRAHRCGRPCRHGPISRCCAQEPVQPDNPAKFAGKREDDMATRRDFIGGAAGAMAGAAFVGCDLLAPAHVHAQGAPARRREVVVNGRRVKTVDVHAHCAFPQAMALMGMKVNPDNLVMGADRIRAMDEQGIDIEALSINPYWYKAERDVAQAVIKMQNEKLAELCAAQPDRFVAFATIALQHPDLGSSKRASRRLGCAESPSAATSRAASSPIRHFIRSGPRRKNSAAWSSSTRCGCRSSTRGSPATAT